MARATADADWFPDPLRRFEYRYWDGASWTDHVATRGRVSSDPLQTDGPHPRDPRGRQATQPRVNHPTSGRGPTYYIWSGFGRRSRGVAAVVAGLVVSFGLASPYYLPFALAFGVALYFGIAFVGTLIGEAGSAAVAAAEFTVTATVDLWRATADARQQWADSLLQRVGDPNSTLAALIRKFLERLRAYETRWGTYSSEEEQRPPGSSGAGNQSRPNDESTSSVITDYEALGLPPDATWEEIRHRYHELAWESHPDRHREASEEELQRFNDKMKVVNAAFDSLKLQYAHAA